jgi:hypothetical protein
LGTLKSRINQLIEVRERQLPVLMKNRADGQKDLDGSSSNAYAGTVRFLAIARYAAKSDILAIKEGLAAVASVRLDLINRFDAGEPISPSYAAMLTYKALLGALASGDMVIARLLAARMGGPRRT